MFMLTLVTTISLAISSNSKNSTSDVDINIKVRCCYDHDGGSLRDEWYPVSQIGCLTSDISFSQLQQRHSTRIVKASHCPTLNKVSFFEHVCNSGGVRLCTADESKHGCGISTPCTLKAPTATTMIDLLSAKQSANVKQATLNMDAHFNFNIIFIKLRKVGGSTAAGVLRQVAATHGLSGAYNDRWITKEPGIWANHSPLPLLLEYASDLRMKTVYISWIRRPLDRCLSQYYYRKSNGLMSIPLLDWVDRMAKNGTLREHQDSSEEYIRMGICSNALQYGLGDNVDKRYAFIGVMEHFDESMIAMKYVLNLTLVDILFVEAKRSGQDLTNNGKKVIDTYSKFVNQPQSIRDKLAEIPNERDNEIYTMAVDNLMSRIKTIPNFDQELRTYRQALHTIQFHCSKFVYDQTDCYWGDNGCGIKCIHGLLSMNDHGHGDQSH